MTTGTPSRLIAGCCGMAAFAVAIVVGLSVENPADTILARAMASMFVCYLVGMGVGLLAERAVEESLAEKDGTDVGAEAASAHPSGDTEVVV